jgi:phosphopantetheine--protein transferase-like protein
MHPSRQSENLDRLVTGLTLLARPGETVLGLGNDIAEVRRIAVLIDRPGGSFLTRSFTPAEIGECNGRTRPAIHFAGKWAAKEAVYKALSLRWNRPFSWKEIEVLSSGADGGGSEGGGPPRINLSEQIHEQLRAAREQAQSPAQTQEQEQYRHRAEPVQAQPQRQIQGTDPIRRPPRILVSISHCDEFAFAVAIAVTGADEPIAARIITPATPPAGGKLENT